VSTDSEKTEAMLKWHVPQNFTKLWGFIGLTGYYRKFVKQYGILAKPLTNILHNKSFHWSEDAQQAFDKLKTAMITTPVLAFLDFTKTFIVETNACDTVIGVVLS
jgi:hypothetical protein